MLGEQELRAAVLHLYVHWQMLPSRLVQDDVSRYLLQLGKMLDLAPLKRKKNEKFART